MRSDPEKRSPADDRGRSRKQIELILRSTAEMKELIENLLEAATIEAGKFTLETSQEDVWTVVAEALQLLEPLASAESITLMARGIPADQIVHLFERYSKAKKTTGQGAGLGLFIVRGIVQAHGGRVLVESEVGRGSTFHFTIPSAASSRQPAVR